MKKILLFVAVFSSVLSFGQKSTSKVPQLGKDPIDKVIAAMTLEEKAQLLIGGNHEFSINKMGRYVNLVPWAAGTTVSIPRLGIPFTVLTDGPAGVRIKPTRDGDSKTYYCTGFPVATLLASTWNPTMVNRVGQAMGNEVLEYGCDVLLAPAINLHRNPLCGRNFEYYSEDPVLIGKLSAQMIKGVQSQNVGTSLKHFAANDQETFRLINNSIVSQRALRELYLKGFEIAVKEAQPWTIMSSYNKINGVYTQDNLPLLTTVLRDEWGFKGIVMTDWTGDDYPHNTVAQVHGGNDLMMPGYNAQYENILEAVKNGKLSMADVNRNVKRMLEYILKTPHFRKYAFTNTPDLKAHAEVARTAADDGIILLKNNDNTLPLQNSTKNIALFGTGSYDFLAGGWGSGDVNKAYVINEKQGLENAGFNIDEETKSLYEGVKGEMQISSSYAKLRAKNADIAIITLQRNSGEGSDRYNREGDFELTKDEKAMLKNITDAFHAVGKKVVVVLNIAGVIETASWKDIPDAIVLAWLPSQEGGNSIADILTGKVNPSGRLPMTFPNAYMDIPSSKNFPNNYKGEPYKADVKNIGYTNYEEGIWVGYRYFSTFNKPVSYPFGYGLSYTTFSLDNAKVKKSGKVYSVSVHVTNTGSVAGKNVVELFVAAPKGKIEKPARELKAFAKTKVLQPGESEDLLMTFSVPELASFDEASNSWVVDSGTYKLQLCSSAQDVLQTLSVNINKPMIIPVKAKL
jgi:beta-glucosidase